MSRDINETRNRILNAAWKLLEAGQGSGVRMSDIAKTAGISRQAVYLHFPTRAELLTATTRYLDEINNADERLMASRNAATGLERLEAFIEAWGNYIPEIYGVARALMAMEDTDEAAKLAWADRKAAIAHGCQAAVKALKNDGVLLQEHTIKEATDILFSLLSVQTWENLTQDCGWSQRQYVKKMKALAKKMLVAEKGS
ncbi:MAG: TetR/AcrR family transcriptional regulator [Rhodospirillaceae bacterium]|jgi:AcrR family transcriptional regulator|nr:TetR/AcrR family transcriptional regulator [Rhodospirillaceae bacterium]MBT5243500.1 TetR/AcrR family transcriptional regulator [Rhodospirillaceae bacterium]MBT5562088.1 TetR/AcrR family transcriptional regulator [Rhodospirillaceae bacterium]MBT6242261.1 TetR/AcrR family transcriptional regulator [Rhodospirillaceae bacterium]MBT7136915.1 TetR/AcrR family transcriptional regulator [Rhodospirillaceae bacterium]